MANSWITNRSYKIDDEGKKFITEVLNAFDLHSFETVGKGEEDFVIKDEEKGLAVRVGSSIYRPEEPEILQPIHNVWVGGAAVSILKLVNTKDVTDKHVKTLKNKLGAKGWNFNDSRKDNVGLLDDGTPVVTDPGNMYRNTAYSETTEEGSRNNPDAKFLKTKESHFLGDRYLALRQRLWFFKGRDNGWQ